MIGTSIPVEHFYRCMDELILQACRSGDPRAVEELVRRYQGSVYRVCLSILGDPPEAEDAAQETFISALHGLNGFRGGSAFSTWLYAIAVNACRRSLKRRKRNRSLHSTLALDHPVHADPPSDPEQTLIRSEVNEALWLAISALDEKHRLPVILRYYHELPVAEIAEILKVNEGTIHSRLFNARERLRGEMKVRETLFKDKKGARA
jgi:RNA polymerase sigma-70 factor (ECF subfamily)